MDSLLTRQKEIIVFLIDKIDYIPVKNIAENIRVSEKTVYRELKMIEKYLKKECIYLEKRPGIGVKLNINEEQKMKLNFDIRSNKSNTIDYISTDARRQKILSDLLSNSPKTYSVQKLSEKYFISRASIVNDFKYIENYIKKYNLKLEKSKEGTKLIGSEINIRKTMVSLINELIVINSNKNSDFQSERIDNQTLDELFHQFGKNDVNIIKEILKDIEIKMNYVMGEVYYINLITHLLILIKRCVIKLI